MTTTDPTIDISLRTVNIGLPSGVDGYIEHNNPVDITLELQDVNGVTLEKIGYKVMKSNVGAVSVGLLNLLNSVGVKVKELVIHQQNCYRSILKKNQVKTFFNKF